MLFKLIKGVLIYQSKHNMKQLSTSNQKYIKVAICGASGRIGQPLSLLLKQSSLITELSLYDIVHAIGVAADLSHVETSCKVKGYVGPEKMKDALKGSQVVIIPAGVGRKPGMTRNDLFNVNAFTIKEIITAVAEVTPKALIGIITNPVNSLIPLAAEILKIAGVYDPNRLFGVTTLDIVRARTFIAEAKGLDVNTINIPVIGGHADSTIIPLISQCTPPVSFSKEEIEALTVRVQTAGTEVVIAKAGAGTASLSMAYAGGRFTYALCRSLKGESNIVECSYVQSNVSDTTYFATPILLGANGIQKNLGLGKLSDYENQLVKAAIPELKKNIQRGENFVLLDKNRP